VTPLPVADRWKSGQIKNVAAVTLGKMLQPNDSGDDRMASYMRAANVQPDGVLMLEAKQMWFSANELEVLTLRRGDVVVVEGGVGGYGRAAYLSEDLDEWGFQNSINRLRPNSDTDGRFVAYYLIALRASGFIERYCNVVSMPHLTAEKLAAIPVPIPDRSEQSAIADYLDRETARIDTLIDEQRRLIEMLRERRACAVDLALAEHGLHIPNRFEGYDPDLPEGWRIVLLGRTLKQLTNGFVGPTRDILADDGVRYIQGTHIKSGRIDFERRPFYVSRDWHEERPRIHLRAGDVLIVQTGDVGKVAVVPRDFGEASCHALQIARTRPEILSGEYLGAFLSSRLGYQSLIARATGALHPHLEAGIRSAPIVVPPLEVQDRIVQVAAQRTAKVDALITETARFVELSLERRSALITAAVTGQIDVLAGVV